MIDLHARKIKDIDGNNMVMLPEGEFDALIRQLEDIEDVYLYDQAKLEDDGTSISFEDYIKARGFKHEDIPH